MTKTFITILLTCCSFAYSFGQAPSLILTKAQNDKWLDSVSTSPFSTQLQMVRERLLADTNVVVEKSYPDGIKPTDSLGNRVYGAVKPLVMVENVPLTMDNPTDTKKIKELVQLLDTTYIDTITLKKGADPKALAVYGSGAWSGVILLKLKEKKDLKRFQQLGLH